MNNFLMPAFSDNNITIVFASSNEFAPYACVAILSAVEKTSPDNNYDMVVIASGITSDNKTKISDCCSRPNVSIRFFDANIFFDKHSNIQFPTTQHITKVTFLRLFIAEMLPHHSKAVCIDSDTISNEDPAILFNTDLEGYAVGATLDLGAHIVYYNSKEFSNLWDKVFELEQPYKYFNAGILVLDLKTMRETNVLPKFRELILKHNKKLAFLDQDVLNICFNKSFKEIDISWNTIRYLNTGGLNVSDITVLKDTYKSYLKAIDCPKIIHYVGGKKPWRLSGQKLPYTDLWNKVAMKTPYKLTFALVLFKDRVKYLIENIFSISNSYIDNKKVKCIKILGMKIYLKK